ncbi:MAG: nucleotide sugar dehydrogenase [Rhodobacteraceae bacterium]|nr:nucleotide sugar dehydrogenase [Paracoccaceae bacterium]
MNDTPTIAVIGLGYVGLPLAVAFGRRGPVIGYDIDPDRIAALKRSQDATREVEAEALAAADLRLTADLEALRPASVYIVTVPTPVDASKTPDLGPLLAATRSVGEVLAPGDTVIFESTVYPGATEDDCVPVLETVSGLTFNRDFTVGYSPERANPGDTAHRLATIVKVTAGSTPEAAAFVDALYAGIVPAGTHRAPSIRVAEAAKVIENTQRDVNIALVNELALIFQRLGLDTGDVLDAAGTKWNFLPFRPGLVGGHCIGVDPYYLTHKAQSVGYHPEVVLAGRRINDRMGIHVATQLVREMIRRDLKIRGNRVLVLGLAFKENCPDLRNTRVIDVIEELRGFGLEVDVCDPWADPAEAEAIYGLALVDRFAGVYDGIVLAVGHAAFAEDFAAGRPAYCAPDHVIFDVKSVVPREMADLSVLRL